MLFSPQMCLSTGLQKEILHDVMVVGTAAVREVAGCKHNDGIQTFSIITCKKQNIWCDLNTNVYKKQWMQCAWNTALMHLTDLDKIAY